MLEAKLPLEEITEQLRLANSRTLEKLEEIEALNIKYLLDSDAANYKKRMLRRLSDRTVPLLFASCGCSSASAQANEMFQKGTFLKELNYVHAVHRMDEGDFYMTSEDFLRHAAECEYWPNSRGT